MGIFDRKLMTAFAFASCAMTGPALALDGQPAPWQMGFQRAATPVMAQITAFHAYVTAIVVVIGLFVLALLLWVIFRFNEKKNPVPSRTSHHTVLEIAWTVLPILILVAIAIPSFRLLFAEYDFPKPDVTITATGNQWYWTYEYPDQGITFDSIMVADQDLKPGEPRLLTVDHEVVVPVHKNIQVQVKSSLVIHDWAMPSFGIKIDAVPGRLETTWFRADRTGVFHGECSELCGQRHAFMPIVVRVVTDQEYADWLAKTKAAASLEQKSNVAVASK